MAYLEFFWLLRAVCSYVLQYLFCLFVLCLLVRVVVLYLLYGCLIPNTRGNGDGCVITIVIINLLTVVKTIIPFFLFTIV